MQHLKLLKNKKKNSVDRYLDEYNKQIRLRRKFGFLPLTEEEKYKYTTLKNKIDLFQQTEYHDLVKIKF